MTAESARDDDMATDPLRELLREAREDLLAWASSGLPADSIVEKRTLDLATRIDAALAQQPEPTYTPAQMAENFRAGMNTAALAENAGQIKAPADGIVAVDDLTKHQGESDQGAGVERGCQTFRKRMGWAAPDSYGCGRVV